MPYDHSDLIGDTLGERYGWTPTDDQYLSNYGSNHATAQPGACTIYNSIKTRFQGIGHTLGRWRSETKEWWHTRGDRRCRADLREIVDAGFRRLQNERIQQAEEIYNKLADIGAPDINGTDPRSKHHKEKLPRVVLCMLKINKPGKKRAGEYKNFDQISFEDLSNLKKKYDEIKDNPDHPLIRSCRSPSQTEFLSLK
jgi:hypothetical protein